MPMCEDYPCCGHERGDCPDSSGRMKCVECGKRLSKRSASSICRKCLARLAKHWDSSDFDHDYSMNY